MNIKILPVKLVAALLGVLGLTVLLPGTANASERAVSWCTTTNSAAIPQVEFGVRTTQLTFGGNFQWVYPGACKGEGYTGDGEPLNVGIAAGWAIEIVDDATRNGPHTTYFGGSAGRRVSLPYPGDIPTGSKYQYWGRYFHP